MIPFGILKSSISVPSPVVASGSDPATARSYTFSSQSLGEADSDRYLIVCITATTASTTNYSGPPTVTLGGVTLTHRHSHGVDSAVATVYTLCSIHSALVPSGTTGDLVIDYTGVDGGASTVAIGYTIYRALGLTDGGAYYSVGTPQGSSSAVSETLSTTVDVPAGPSFVIGLAGGKSGTGGYGHSTAVEMFMGSTSLSVTASWVGSSVAVGWTGLTENIDIQTDTSGSAQACRVLIAACFR